MYQALIAACLLLAATESAYAGSRQDVLRHAKAATVLIVGTDEATHSLSLGSGFFVDAGGLLVTNAHVIEDSSHLYVYVLDREIYAAPEVVAVDPDADLAVLRVPHTSAAALTLAADSTPEGTEVIAVGYPRITDILNMGFTLHATSIPAMVSGLVQGQSRAQKRPIDFLQTTGLLNFGNSGGPLVLSDSGEVVAMVVTSVPYLERAKDAQGVAIGNVMMKSGISYSIPASAIRQWLAANHLSPTSVQPVQAPPPFANAAQPRADRAFATGYLLHTMAKMLHGDADLLKLAVRHYHAAAELRPEAPGILRNLGLAYAALEQWDQAVQAYRKAMALAPDDMELFAEAAVATQRWGRTDDSATLSRAALNNTSLQSPVSAEMAGRLNADSEK
jgi:Trypsin-like peptidase domain/Tetratricopeptide repeat